VLLAIKAELLVPGGMMNRRYDEATSEGSSVAVGSVLGHIISEVPAPECTCTQALTRIEVAVGGRGERRR
jgi:hypothetical protein